MKIPHVLVSGLLNVETVVPVEGFPIPYCPITYPFHQVHTAASGVALNLGCALHGLGSHVQVFSTVARDGASMLIRQAMRETGLSEEGLYEMLPETPLSVVLHAPDGGRRIFCDLKAAQTTRYPPEAQARAFGGKQRPDLAILCNIEFSRPWLAPAKAAGCIIATDLHVFSDPADAYHADFLQAADIVFLSHEGLPCAPVDFFPLLQARTAARIMVITMGKDGAMLHERESGATRHVPAVPTRAVVDSVGAGDATLAAFCHHYLCGDAPELALRKAMVFASWKIGESGGARGFPEPETYARLLREHVR